MKKLMIAACAVALAAAAQAASVSWEAGSFADLPECLAYKNGGEGATGYGPDFSTACIKAFVFESSTAFTYADSEAVWNAFKSADGIDGTLYTKEFDVNTGALNVTGGNGYTEGDNVYAAIVYVHSDTQDFDNPDFYIANIAAGQATDDGATVSILASKWEGNPAGESIGWAAATTAAPEPTSGLLLLLGVAGLALRRRRA